MPDWVYNELQARGSAESIADLVADVTRPIVVYTTPNWKDLSTQVREVQTPTFSYVNVISPWDAGITEAEYFASHNVVGDVQMGDTPGNWHNWNLANWGVKWDSDAERSDDGTDPMFAEWRFDSPDRPPTPVIETLAAKHPSIAFTHRYRDESGASSDVAFVDGLPVAISQSMAPGAVDRGITNFFTFVLVGASNDESYESYERAADAWREAESLGDPAAREYLVDLESDGPFLAVLARATDRRHPDALFVAGLLASQSGDSLGAERLWHDAAERGSPHAMNNLGDLAEEAGDSEEAVRWWEASAATGHPIGLATLLWKCVLTGDFHQGINWFAQYGGVGIPAGTQPTDLIQADPEWANLYSNYALVSLASGGERKLTQLLWTLCAQAGMFEAALYLAVLESTSGGDSGAVEAIAACPPEEHERLAQMASEVESAAASPWTREWYSSARGLLGYV